MRYGAHVFLWQDRYGNDELERILDSAAGLGLSFVEVAVGDELEFDAAKLSQAARGRGIELVVSPGGVWPMECDVSLPRPNGGTAGIEWHRRMIDRAAEVGAVAYAGAIYGHPGRVERRRPDADELARTASALSELAEYAADRNVALVLEPMSHFRTHIANTPAQVNELIGLINHANVVSLLDTYHLVTEVGDLAAAFEEMRRHLWGLHACENHRGAPGTGMVPWKPLIAAVVRSGWDGRIGFESYNSTWRGGRFAWERGMFHNVCPDAEGFIRSAKAFLEGCFAEYGVP